MTRAATRSLDTYQSMRDFSATPEPKGQTRRAGKQLSFVIQKHDASHLHYDFRLELGGVLVSWAVPKGPSLDPKDKRLAVHVEDHPLSYADFEGTIPAGHYGAGDVLVWDHGTWEPLDDPDAGLDQGKLHFRLHGQKLGGDWELVRTARQSGKKPQWLLFKKHDEFARSRADFDVLTALPDSVIQHPLQSPEKPKAAPPKKAAATPRAALPATLSPQLATLAESVPDGEWTYEIKFDGYRLLSRIERGKARLMTRGGKDWTNKMPHIAKALQSLALKGAWIDGEIVVLNRDGLPSFQALQNAFDAGSDAEIVYFAFDLPYLDGHDLRHLPLRERREKLGALLHALKGEAARHLRFSEAFEAPPATVLTSACNMNLEGVIAKRADAPYRSTRTADWLKLKCKQRQEFVVCGYTQRKNTSDQVGSLALGVFDEHGELQPAGRVGTGWTADTAAELHAKLKPLRRKDAPFEHGAPKGGHHVASGPMQWVSPKLVAEVSFAEWTGDGSVRHASFMGLRRDKKAGDVVREKAPAAVEPAVEPAKSKSAKTPALTHPERVVDKSTGLTKLDVARYYESVADWLLPHLRGRPASLVRAPDGIESPLFFQKHGRAGMEAVKTLDAKLWPGHEALIEVDTLAGLMAAAQMNMLELHTWNSRSKKLDTPDRMVFDLDPGEGVAWAQVQEAATLVHALLQELGLRTWIKTSGGKGLHLVVPIAARYDFDTVKAFSRAIVQHLADTLPQKFVVKSGPANRVGKIFVDYLRNGFGATTAAAFSARARPGLGVSMPIAWEDLAQVKGGDAWTIRNARDHLSLRKTDPWADYAQCRQGLKAAMGKLEFSHG